MKLCSYNEFMTFLQSSEVVFSLVCVVILFQVVWETWERSGKRVRDYNLYTGVLGTAYLLFKSYQVTRNEDDLKLCLENVEACDVASRDSE